MKILEDENFEEEFQKIIVPFCEKYETEEYFESFDKKKMHFLSYVNESAKANILIFHGFTEFAEKFRETAYYFFSEGYNVFSLDLRGHGKSFKDEAVKFAVTTESFDCYAQDVKRFAEEIGKKNNLPIYAFSHSLGSTAVLLAEETKNVKFEKLVLSSPMICGNMGMPVSVANAVAKLLVKLKLGGTAVPGKCEPNFEKDNSDAASVQRGRFALKLKKENEAYQTFGPTFKWVSESVNARDRILKEENIQNLGGKMLVIKPEKDAQLLEEYQDKFIEMCRKHGKDIAVLQTENTCHEIFQSKSSELEKYYSEILKFFAEN